MKVKLITFSILIILIFYGLNQYINPNYIRVRYVNNFIVLNQKGIKINCQTFLKKSTNVSNDEVLVIIFNECNPKLRIHIDFKNKLIGFPEFGNKNYRLENNSIKLYKENIFYKDGSLYHPFFNKIDLNYYFLNNYVKFETMGSLKKYGKYIIVKEKTPK